MKVLFVCTAAVVRSPMAVAIFLELAGTHRLSVEAQTLLW